MSERLTKRQAAIVGAYTGFLAGNFSDLHEFIEEVMERPVWTHEMASERFSAQLKEKARPYFLEICNDDD